MRRRCGLAVAPSDPAVELLAKSTVQHKPQKMECVWYMGTYAAGNHPEGLKDLESDMRMCLLVPITF